MVVTLYRRFSTLYLLFGMAFLYVLDLGLCAFFCYRFLYQTFDPSVFLLLATLIIPLVLIPILAHPHQVLSRFLVRCRIDESGLHCFGLGWKSWDIAWQDICIYGIQWQGSSNYPYGLLSFSKDAEEQFHIKNFIRLTPNRVVFEVRPELWRLLCQFMPEDIHKKLAWSMETKRNCFYKR